MRCTPFLLAVLLALPAVAQNAKPADVLASACGPADTKFKATTEAAGKAQMPSPDKAMVYVIGVQERVGFCPLSCGVTLKVGLDGGWIGATNGNSFLSMVVDPGEHHLCTAWQSKLKSLRNHLQLAGFAAEPGQTYYFRAHITPGTTESISGFELQAVNADEGKLLVASSPKSVWTTR